MRAPPPLITATGPASRQTTRDRRPPPAKSLIYMKFSAVKILVAANVLAFLLQSMSRGVLEYYFALWPLQPIDGRSYFHFWQLITYAFLHSTGNITHLLFNILGLGMMCYEIKHHVGHRRRRQMHEDPELGVEPQRRNSISAQCSEL